MSGDLFRRVMAGETDCRAFGVAWIPAHVACEFTGLTDAARAVTAIAERLRADVAFVPAESAWAPDCVELLRETGIACAWSVAGAFGRACEKLGWSRALGMTVSSPGGLAAPMAEALHDALDEVRRGCALAVDAVVVADDLAHMEGWLVPPDFAIASVVACASSAASEAAVCGVPSLFHSDGDIHAAFPALARAGFAGVHAGALPAGRLEGVVRAAGDSGLVFAGGIRIAALTAGEEETALASMVRLPTRGSVVVCDDGGVSVANDVAGLVRVHEAIRGGLEAQ